MPIIAMTTSSSTSVKPRRSFEEDKIMELDSLQSQETAAKGGCEVRIVLQQGRIVGRDKVAISPFSVTQKSKRSSPP